MMLTLYLLVCVCVVPFVQSHPDALPNDPLKNRQDLMLQQALAASMEGQQAKSRVRSVSGVSFFRLDPPNGGGSSWFPKKPTNKGSPGKKKKERKHMMNKHMFL